MFQNARVTLTAWYLLIIMVISLSFSIVLYRGMVKEVERFARMQQVRMERRVFDNGPFDPAFIQTIEIQDVDLVREIKMRILTILFIINGSIFFIAGGFGYVLAGKTLNPIKQMMDEQNRFISDASHEFRTPLTFLKTAMEVHLRNKKAVLKDANLLISESIEEVNRLQALSEELLQLTQYEKPNGHMKQETISLTEVVKQAIKKVEPLAKKKNIIISSRLLDIHIKGNIYALLDLFVVILDNAIKYSPSKSRVDIHSKQKDKYSVISIQDSGIGIKKKDLPHIFDRFYRADTARTKTNEGGYGLGLSIAKKIIDCHQGSIHIESTFAKGTKVVMQFVTV